jgi:hypothetical protein
VIELIDRAAIELAAGNELVARFEQRMECEELRRVARGDGERRGGAFERGDALFEDYAAWSASLKTNEVVW